MTGAFKGNGVTLEGDEDALKGNGEVLKGDERPLFATKRRQSRCRCIKGDKPMLKCDVGVLKVIGTK